MPRKIPKKIEVPVFWYVADLPEIDGEIVFDEEAIQDAFREKLEEIMNHNPNDWIE